MKAAIALDHSEPSIVAARYLAGLPAADKCDVDWVTVVEPVAVYEPMGSGYAVDISHWIEERSRQTLERLQGTAREFSDSFRNSDTHCLVGSPGPKILEFADQHEIDLTVLGAVGHSAIARILLGSTSDFIATHGNGSVLVVRGEADVPPRRVLIGISNDATDYHLLEWIERLGLEVTTEIYLCHTVQVMPESAEGLLTRASKYWKDVHSIAGELIAQGEQQLRDWGYPVQTHVGESTHIGQSMLDYASEIKADLILVGDSRSSTMQRLMLGSTSRDVLRHADCSVLIARPTA